MWSVDRDLIFESVAIAYGKELMKIDKRFLSCVPCSQTVATTSKKANITVWF